MKKALSLFLILLFIFSFIPAFASDDMEQILISLKKRIPSTEKYEEFNSRVNQYNNKTFYAFEWYSNADGKFSSMNVTVSDSGIITSFINRIRKQNQYQPPFLRWSSAKSKRIIEKLKSFNSRQASY